MAIYISTPCLEGSDNQMVPISEDTVLKEERLWEYAYAEALAMDLVRNQTSIPIPYMRKLVGVNGVDGEGLILMDLVRNAERLETAWPSLSFWKKLKVGSIPDNLGVLSTLPPLTYLDLPDQSDVRATVSSSFLTITKDHLRHQPLSRLISESNTDQRWVLHLRSLSLLQHSLHLYSLTTI